VIDLSDGCRELERNGDEFTVGAGVWGTDLVRFTAETGYAGLASLAGIPGSIGGWMKMNAGAFRHTISEVTESVDIMNLEGKITTLNKEEIKFAYRQSPGLKGKIVTGAKLRLTRGDKSEIISEVAKTIATRYERNVMTLPSAGSIFKNPQGYFAAKLIESLGFKGVKSGNVRVSELHANFIVNSGGGSATDVKKLINTIRGKVKAEYGVELETEVKMLGWASA
jgi:UDP-N-acetylmuramate dehydrogenase